MLHASDTNLLLDTIDGLYATLDKLNLSGGYDLYVQQDGKPYGAIHTALKTCVANLLELPGEDFRLPNGKTLTDAFMDELYDEVSARGALSDLVDVLSDLKDDTASALCNARQENVHEDEIEELATEAHLRHRIYTTVRDCFYAANAA